MYFEKNKKLNIQFSDHNVIRPSAVNFVPWVIKKHFMLTIGNGGRCSV